ncbi:MAG TPA: cyclic nucleotide-binding domain-containing protein, partial [Candidatus Acidoferrales bacterium]|nr:cyclic nucleotide-binding domain-containing protein [Candidatus Acidoferrales bacterium]
MNEAKAKSKSKGSGKRNGRRKSFRDPLTLLDAAGLGRKAEARRKRDVIFSEGEPSKNVYYIRDGSVKLSVTSKEGKEAVVGILGPTDFFGEDGIAGTKVCMSTATATTDCDLVRIDNKRMAQVLHGDRDFSDFFMSYLLTRKARVEADLVDQLFNSS